MREIYVWTRVVAIQGSMAMGTSDIVVNAQAARIPATTVSGRKIHTDVLEDTRALACIRAEMSWNTNPA